MVETTARVTVRNATDRPLLAIFEPWCETYELPPGAEYVFEATSRRVGQLTVEPGIGTATVYAWDACIGRVFDAAGRLVDSLHVRTP